MLKWRWSRRWGRALGGAHSKSGAGWIVKLHASICRGTHRCLSSAAGKGDKRVPEGGGIEAGSFRAIICDVGLKLPANMALRVEIVGARELLSSSNMWGLNSINPSVVIKMGAAEASTALLESKSNPVWGESFYFQFNPSASLEITVRDRQFLRQERIGDPIIIPVDAVEAGLRGSWQHGEKTWPIYFHLGVSSAEDGPRLAVPRRPGSDEVAIDGAAPGTDGEEVEHKDQNVMPMGMYGQRRTVLPRVRGRLYVTFSLVEWVSASQREESSSRILPQPREWPPRPEDPSASEIRAERERRWRPDYPSPPGKTGKVFRVLALDGGGVRGLLTASLIERMCRKFPNMLNEVDVIVGTSIGGLLSILLAAGYSPEQTKSIYYYHMPKVFTTTPARRYSLFSSTYPKEGLQDLVEVYLKDRTLADLDKHVIVTSFKVNGMPEVCETPGRQQRWQPVLLSNIARGDFSKGEPDIDLPAREAAMRTSAAPTFFPLHGGYADGAIFANNPSLVGVAKMKAHYPHLKMAEMRVLSIGTGGFPYSIDLHGNNDADWGLRQWAPHLVDMLFDASAVNVDMNLRLLMGDENYHRLDPPLPWKIALDDATALRELVDVAEEANLSETEQFLRERWGAHEI